MGRVERIDDETPDTSRYSGRVRRRKNVPAFAAVNGSKNAEARIGVSAERLASPVPQYTMDGLVGSRIPAR